MKIDTWEEAKKVLDEHPEAYKQALNNQIIYELEKIKKEIDDKGKIIPDDFFIKEGMLVFKSIVDEIINEHIADLKGEQE